MERDLSRVTAKRLRNFIFNSGFYFLLSWSFLFKFRIFDIQESKLLWPVFWVSQESVDQVVLITKWILLVAPFLTCFKKTRLSGQVLTFLAALVLIAISYSNGKSYHSGLAWIIFMISLFATRFFTKPHNAVHFSFFCFATAYLNSGIWKMRTLLSYLWETGDFSIVLYTLQEHISDSAVERVQPPTLLGSWVVDHLWLSGVLWCCALLVEFSPLLIPFYRKKAWLIALALCSFHVGVFLTLRISFLPSIILLLALSLYFYLALSCTKRVV